MHIMQVVDNETLDTTEGSVLDRIVQGANAADLPVQLRSPF
jgi:hypothetical protein